MTVHQTTAGEWVDALRSGKYNQGRGSLKMVGSISQYTTHCCLGVLCDLIDPDGWGELAPGATSNYTIEPTVWYGVSALTPGSVSGQLGNLVFFLDSEEDQPAPRRVHGMNDDGESFSVIADRIEKELQRDQVITFETEV